MSDKIAVIDDDGDSLVPMPPAELSVPEIIRRAEVVKEVTRKAMTEGVHYGTIPGTKKPTLYKPGAEVLALTFQFSPKYEVTEEKIEIEGIPPGHIKVDTRTSLYSPDGRFLGEGLGSCTTLESKYRYRTEKKNTNKPVPQAYWEKRDKDGNRDQSLLGGKGFSALKVDGKWFIAEAGEKVENDPYDHYNTVLKISKKRSHVDAVLTRTAASESFTQDLEDGVSDESGKQADKPKEKTKARSAPPREAQKKQEPIPIDAESEDSPPDDLDMGEAPKAAENDSEENKRNFLLRKMNAQLKDLYGSREADVKKKIAVKWVSKDKFESAGDLNNGQLQMIVDALDKRLAQREEQEEGGDDDE